MTDTKQEEISKFQRQTATDLDSSFDQRDACNEDIRFIRVAKAQWEGLFKDDESNNQARFVFDQTERQINRFMAIYAKNPVSVKFSPSDEVTEESDAEILTGLYRFDERRSNGQLALTNAISEASTGGFGALRLVTSFVNENDDEDERQQIDIKPIFEAYATVVWDSNAKEHDKADAKRCTILHQFTREAFEDKWPDHEAVSFIGIDDRRYLNSSSKNDYIIVAERYDVKKIKKKVLVYQHPLTEAIVEYAEDEILDVMDELKDFGFEFVKRKTIKRIEVIKNIMSGKDFLEKPKRIAGENIPVVPFYAYRSFFDGAEVYSGLVRKMKDPQRALNMAVSQIAEVSATSPREMPIFSPEQVAGHQNNWAAAHLGQKPFMLLNSQKDAQGNPIAAGPVAMLRPPNIAPATVSLIDTSSAQLQLNQTQNPGEINDLRASGAAIDAVTSLVDLDTLPVVQSIGFGVKRLGDVYTSMGSEVYADSRPVKVLNEDGTELDVLLSETVIDEDTGEKVRLRDLSRGSFQTVAQAGASFNTKREQSAKGLSELVNLIPEESPLFAAAIGGLIQNLDGVGLDDLKKLNRFIMLNQGTTEPKTEEEIAFVEQIQQQRQLEAQNPQQSPEQIFAEGEFIKNVSDARVNESVTIKNLAVAEKDRTLAAKNLSEIPLNQAKTLDTEKAANSKTIDNVSKILTARTDLVI